MTTTEILNRGASYLSNEIDLDTFEDCIAEETWNIHKSADRHAADLAYAIEAKLAEASSGQISEVVLRRELTSLLAFHDRSVSLSMPGILFSSDAESVSDTNWREVSWRIGEIAVDTTPVVVRG